MSSPVVDRPKNRFIDPKVLIKIQNMELMARTVVEGFVTGFPHLRISVSALISPNTGRISPAMTPSNRLERVRTQGPAVREALRR